MSREELVEVKQRQEGKKEKKETKRRKKGGMKGK